MERKRLLLPGFISPALCEELVFIHKSCGVVGYRPHVFSTTLSHLVATNSAALIMPFISLRERVKEAVEEFFDCEFELFVEFTGLISWTTGANIGWHSDDNREYLRQRHFSTVLIYSADDKNIHSVDEVVDGERITMALWFTRDPAHDEDKKLIDQLMNAMPLLRKEHGEPRISEVRDLRRENTGTTPQPSQEIGRSEENADEDLVTTKIEFLSAPSHAVRRDSFVPVPASTNMYCVSERETESKTGHNVGCRPAHEAFFLDSNQGFDVRVKRLASLGFHCVGQLDGTSPCLAHSTNISHVVLERYVWFLYENCRSFSKNSQLAVDLQILIAYLTSL